MVIICVSFIIPYEVQCHLHITEVITIRAANYKKFAAP